MTFVNEFISKDDADEFGLEAIDKRFIVGGTRARDWTIDRDRNIYLRVVARGREEFFHQSFWTFYWHGDLLEVELENISTTGSEGDARHAHKRLVDLSLPGHLEHRRGEVLDDLKEALTVYATGGVFSSCSSYSLTLDVCLR
jgi:hypothetical protein